MDDSPVANVDQAAYWDGPVNDGWVLDQVRLDAMFQPITRHLIEAADIGPGQRVLDVGCGCGETSLLAAAAAEGVSVLGVDLSTQMLERARDRAQAESEGEVTFTRGDAQVAQFDAPFDRILSRFGVMFFDDPEAAFVNLAGHLAPGGRMTFVCWQDVLLNDWMVVPAAAVLQHIGMGELSDESTLPFSLADRAHVEALLERAGLVDIAVDPLVTDLLLGGPGSVEEILEFVVRSGTGHLLLDGADDRSRAAAVDALRDVLTEGHDGTGVPLKASVWIVHAGAPDGG